MAELPAKLDVGTVTKIGEKLYREVNPDQLTAQKTRLEKRIAAIDEQIANMTADNNERKAKLQEQLDKVDDALLL